jgi:hypothetical protein
MDEQKKAMAALLQVPTSASLACTLTQPLTHGNHQLCITSNTVQRQKTKLDRVKSKYNLPRRVMVLRDTAANLRKARSHVAAEDAERQAKILEDRFWKDTLGGRDGVVWKLSAEERALRDKHEMELSAMVSTGGVDHGGSHTAHLPLIKK